MIVGYHTVEDRNNPDMIETSGPFGIIGSNWRIFGDK
jgi:hypothetical protein